MSFPHQRRRSQGARRGAVSSGPDRAPRGVRRRGARSKRRSRGGSGSAVPRRTEHDAHEALARRWSVCWSSRPPCAAKTATGAAGRHDAQVSGLHLPGGSDLASGTPAAIERHQAGWGWLQAGDLRAAERNFNAALKQSPPFYPAEAGLGYVALAQKEHKESLVHFDRAVVDEPALRAGARRPRRSAARARRRARKPCRASKPRFRPIRRSPGCERGSRCCGSAASSRRSPAPGKLAEAGKFDEARAAYHDAIEASPQSPFLYRELAEVERRAGQLDSALDHAPQGLRARARRAAIPHPARRDLRSARRLRQGGRRVQQCRRARSPTRPSARRIENLRSRAAFAAMPPEYRAIGESPALTRGAARGAARREARAAPDRRRDSAARS